VQILDKRYFHDGRRAWGLRHPPFSAIMAFLRLPLFAIKRLTLPRTPLPFPRS